MIDSLDEETDQFVVLHQLLNYFRVGIFSDLLHDVKSVDFLF